MISSRSASFKAHLLEKAGFAVAQAETGAQALALAAAEKLNAVLLDVNLPDMSGEEVGRELKAAFRLPVIYTSSAAIPEQLKQGGDAWIVGVEADELIQIVNSVLLGPAARPPAENGRSEGGNTCPPTAYAPARRSPREELERQALTLECSPLAREVLDKSPIAAAILNDNRQVILANRVLLDLAGAIDSRQVLGLRPGELLQCVHAGERAGGCGTTQFCQTCGAVRAVLEGISQHESVRECHLTRRVDGTQQALDLQISVAPLEGPEQFVLCWVTDVGHQKRRQALERIFFHDVLNAAEGLLGLADEVVRQEQRDAQTSRFSGLMRESAARLVEEIRSQQQLAAAEQDDLTVSASPVYGLQLLKSVARQQREGRVWIDPAAQDALIVTDRALLSRVLENMLRNALEATTPDQRVVAGCRASDGVVEFWVHNPGVMAREAQLQVFRRSFTTKGAGRGLGTYSMKILTERYLGGSVHFRSNAVEGTTFFARIPNNPW